MSILTAAGYSWAANLVQQRHGGGKTSDALFEANICQSDLPIGRLGGPE